MASSPSSSAAVPDVSERLSSAFAEKAASASAADTAEYQRNLVQQILQANTLYEVLGVPEDADESALRRRYRVLALRVHPDKCAAPGAGKAFQYVNTAYETLSDAQSRSRYDIRRRMGDSGVRFDGVDMEDEGLANDAAGEFFARRAGTRGGAAAQPLGVVAGLQLLVSLTVIVATIAKSIIVADVENIGQFIRRKRRLSPVVALTGALSGLFALWRAYGMGAADSWWAALLDSFAFLVLSRAAVSFGLLFLSLVLSTRQWRFIAITAGVLVRFVWHVMRVPGPGSVVAVFCDALACALAAFGGLIGGGVVGMAIVDAALMAVSAACTRLMYGTVTALTAGLAFGVYGATGRGSAVRAAFPVVSIAAALSWSWGPFVAPVAIALGCASEHAGEGASPIRVVSTTAAIALLAMFGSAHVLFRAIALGVAIRMHQTCRGWGATYAAALLRTVVAEWTIANCETLWQSAVWILVGMLLQSAAILLVQRVRRLEAVTREPEVYVFRTESGDVFVIREGGRWYAHAPDGTVVDVTESFAVPDESGESHRKPSSGGNAATSRPSTAPRGTRHRRRR